jgi:hypothetical protein
MRAYIYKFFLSAVLVLATTLPCMAEDTVVLGDTSDKVLSTLGKPRGKMKKGKTEYWSYQRGIVRITENKVTYINIDSKREARKKEARRLSIIRSRAEAERKKAEERKQKIKEGAAARNAKLENEEFQNLPPEKQLEFWTGFQQTYPETNVSGIIGKLQKIVTKENEPEEKSEREVLLETIESKQSELDEWIQKAKTISAGRTWARKYHLARNKLEKELVVLRKQLKEMPKE